MIWSIFQVFGKQGISIIILMILAALLSPEDFGLIAIAFIWITFLNSFSEAGFGSALIQNQNVTTKHYSSVFVLNIIVGIVLSVIGVGLSWPAAQLFSTPKLQPVIAVLSIGFFITSLSLTQITLAQKELRFKDLAIRDIIASIISGVFGIAAALMHFGVWSLVIQSLVMNIVNTIVLWTIADWRPTLILASLKYIKELWPYSSKMFIFNIIKFFAQNIDQFIISFLLGVYAMGIYTFSLKFTMIPITTFVGAIGIYLFPYFAKRQSNIQSIKFSYILTTKITTIIVSPILLLIAMLAPILVPLIWHDTWLDIIPIIQITALLAFTMSLISPIGQLLKALNKPSWLIYWSIYIILSSALFISLGAFLNNITGVAWAICIVYITSLPIIGWIAKKLISITLKEISSMLFTPLLASAGMSAIIYALLRLDISTIPKIIITTLFGSIVYIIILWCIDKPITHTISSYIRDLIKRQSTIPL